MNHATQTAADWRALIRDPRWQSPLALPAWSPCAVTLESTLVTDPAEVERMAQGFDAAAGWLERQSRLSLVEPGQWPSAQGGFDAILAGELAGARAGLLIRRVAEGWHLTWIADHPDPTGDKLCHEEELAGVERLRATNQPFGRRLRYRIYWRHNPETGWRRYAARLLGFV